MACAIDKFVKSRHYYFRHPGAGRGRAFFSVQNKPLDNIPMICLYSRAPFHRGPVRDGELDGRAVFQFFELRGWADNPSDCGLAAGLAGGANVALSSSMSVGCPGHYGPGT